MEMNHSDIVELDLNHPNQAELTLQQLKNLRRISKQLRQQDALDLMVVHVITGGQVCLPRLFTRQSTVVRTICRERVSNDGHINTLDIYSSVAERGRERERERE